MLISLAPVWKIRYPSPGPKLSQLRARPLRDLCSGEGLSLNEALVLDARGQQSLELSDKAECSNKASVPHGDWQLRLFNGITDPKQWKSAVKIEHVNKYLDG